MVVNQAGHACKAGEVGELVHRGPTVCLGYWGDAEATGSVLRPHPLPGPGQVIPELVCYSGDLVRTDEAGVLVLRGTA